MTLNQKALVAGIVAIIKKTIAPRDRRIAELTAQLERLETAVGALSQKTFAQHAIAHDDEGQVWIAERSTITAPGASDDWRLVEDGRVQ